MVNESDKNSKREILELDYLENKTQFLTTREKAINWQQKDLVLFPLNTFDSKSKKTKSSKIQFPDEKPLNTKSSNLSGYFDLHFSPLLWKNQASFAAPELDTSWASNLNHQAQLSYEMGFSFQLHHDKTPLFLQTGLDYQILNEKIDFRLSHTFEDPLLSYWTYDSTFDYQQLMDTFFVIIDSNHFVIDTIFTQDTILTDIDTTYFPVMSTEGKAKKHINSYTYMNIPLLLGYQFQSKNEQWNFQILGGAILGINLANEGYYYNKAGDFVTYSGKVKPSFVWHLQAAANINYRWKKWQIYLQPEFQYQLNESELTNQPPRRKYQFYKLKFGVRYQLF